MAKDAGVAPRVFVSYSWSSPSHELWVIELAERLRSDGVDVVLDKWDLKEGQDKYAFMEQMVTDPSVTKVLAICDAQYAQKADSREGGVGTESQIISKEVYDKADQTKFIAVVAQLDLEGKPYLPAFFRTRIYVDMSSAEKYNDNYQKLIRCVFDRPLYEKPALGTPPAYISDEALAPSKTRGKLEMVKDAIMKDKTHLILGFAADYTTNWYDSLAELRVEFSRDQELDESIVVSIRKSLALRDEFVEFLQFISKFSDDDELFEHIGETYQALLRLYQQPDGAKAWWPQVADNFRFLAYELFLYLTATLVQHNRLKQLDKLLGRSYFDPTARTVTQPNGSFVGFSAFNRRCGTLDIDRNKRLGLRRLSITADILKERATRKDIKFDLLMQADLLLFLRRTLHPRLGDKRWIPETLVFAQNGLPSDLFAKASSKRYFGQLAIILGIVSKDDLITKLAAARSRGEVSLEWLGGYVDLPNLTNLDMLDTES